MWGQDECSTDKELPKRELVVHSTLPYQASPNSQKNKNKHEKQKT